MNRTQIYLSDEELDLLKSAEDATGASRSELIRRAIRKVYGGATKQDRLDALKRSAGSWRDQDYNGAEYVDKMRGEFNARLKRLE